MRRPTCSTRPASTTPDGPGSTTGSTESGRAASHRAHFSWHAALHELALGDTEAVRQRYYTQLAPPAVTGVRALIDSASLLWRWTVTTSGWDAAAATDGVRRRGGAAPGRVGARGRGSDLVDRPETPFVALHAALALAAAGDLPRLTRLRAYCEGSPDLTIRTTVRHGVRRAARGRGAASGAARRACSATCCPGLPRVGGSAAQREIVEETLLFCLVSDGQAERALALLDGRLDRRTSPLDRRRRDALVGSTVDA